MLDPLSVNPPVPVLYKARLPLMKPLKADLGVTPPLIVSVAGLTKLLLVIDPVPEKV